MDLRVHDIGQVQQVEKVRKQQPSNGGFKDIFNAAMNVVDETNTLQKNAEQMSIDFALGKVDSISDVMIAQEKASTALQYTIQIRDKVLESYNQIIRMQV